MRFAVCVTAMLLIAMAGVAQETEREREQGPANTFGFDYDYENFDDDGAVELEDWHLASAELGHRFTGFGSVIGRVNWGKRFGEDGLQYEVDAYPRLGKGTYAYLNAGFSNDDIFPERRYGLQIYRSLGGGFEASIGARLMDFGDSEVTIYTGSIGKYSGNWYVTLQPYFADSDSREDMSQSATVMARRYFRSADDHMTFRGTFGQVPETDILLQQSVELDSWSVRLERQRPLTKTFFIRGYVGYRDQELLFDRERQSILASVGFRARF